LENKLKNSSPEAEAIAYHAGVGIGLSTSLRSTPFRSMHGEIPIPQELLRRNFPYEQVFRSLYDDDDDDANSGNSQSQKPNNSIEESDRQMFFEAIEYMSQTAMEQFQIARSLQSRIQPNFAKPCLLLPIIPSLHYLQKLQGVRYNVFHSLLADPNAQRLKLLFLMSRTWLTGVL
jgi:Squalene/phytoene synthase